MKTLKLLFALLLIGVAGCVSQKQQCDPIDRELVREVMVDFIHAANYSEFDRLRDLTTTDFLMYGDGREMNYDELVQFIKDWPEPDKYNYHEFDFEIESDCNSAFVKYYYGPTDQDVASSEEGAFHLHSVYLVAVGTELKVRFLHSSVVKPS